MSICNLFMKTDIRETSDGEYSSFLNSYSSTDYIPNLCICFWPYYLRGIFIVTCLELQNIVSSLPFPFPTRILIWFARSSQNWRTFNDKSQLGHNLWPTTEWVILIILYLKPLNRSYLKILSVNYCKLTVLESAAFSSI